MITTCQNVKIRFHCFAWHSILFFALITLLAGCAGQESNLVYDTFKLGISNPNTLIDETPLNPNYRYLKVTVNSQPALLVLGYEEPKKNASREVWYSAYKEVIQIQGGRLVSTEGLDTNWTQVQLVNGPPISDAISHTAISAKAYQAKFRFQRIRTVMPGYQVNIRETVVMQALNDIPSDAPKELKDLQDNKQIRWVEETVLIPKQSSNPSIEPLRAIYAVDTKTKKIIFGKQYLTPNDSISWLTWPYPQKPVPANSTGSKLGTTQ